MCLSLCFYHSLSICCYFMSILLSHAFLSLFFCFSPFKTSFWLPLNYSLYISLSFFICVSLYCKYIFCLASVPYPHLLRLRTFRLITLKSDFSLCSPFGTAGNLLTLIGSSNPGSSSLKAGGWHGRWRWRRRRRSRVLGECLNKLMGRLAIC